MYSETSWTQNVTKITNIGSEFDTVTPSYRTTPLKATSLIKKDLDTKIVKDY